MRRSLIHGGVLCCVVFGTILSAAQAPQTPAAQLQRSFADVHARILEMAKDLAEDKYSWRPQPGVRSFGEVFAHVAEGPKWAAARAKGEKAQWGEEDMTKTPNKAAIVAALEKAITDANAALKTTTDADVAKSLAPWLPVIEHSGEHYGQLVAYYRSNGLVPPSSRPKPPK